MKPILHALLFIELVLAAKPNVIVENNSGGAILHVGVASSALGIYFPPLYWPRVDNGIKSSPQRFPGRRDYGNAFSFTFDTEDGRVCYPFHLWDPYELHSLDAADRQITVAIERSDGELTYAIKSTYVSTGKILCYPRSPFTIQVLNLSPSTLYNVSVVHENSLWPVVTSPTCYWPELKAYTASDLQSSPFKFPGNNQFGIKFTLPNGKDCHVDNTWGARIGRERHSLLSTDRSMMIKIQQLKPERFMYTIKTDYSSIGEISCDDWPWPLD